ncbi:MAG: hypothetical protein KGR24_05950 [Planctomycetes bacterium]|nr:hypothetical protein [Planctomycetota bacterium]
MRCKAGFFAGVSPNVGLLLHFDGDDLDTTTIDSSAFGRTVTLGSAAVISTAQSKFGGSSLFLDGSTYANVSVGAQFNIDDRDWTIDAWIYLDAENSASQAMVCEIGNHGGNGVAFWMELSSGEWFPVLWLGSGTSSVGYQQAMGTQAATPGEWTHVALVRDGLTMRMFVDGADAGTLAIDTDTSVSATTNTVQVGGNYTSNPSAVFAGYIDELRVLVGKADFTAAFTPPASAYA